MMKKGRNVISVLTVIILLVLSLTPGIMAVSYPEGVTKEQVTATIGKIDTLIGVVADMVGIYDEVYFSKYFKKHTGKTPNEFRKQGVSYEGF